MPNNKKKPNPIDIHVGGRVRLRRMMNGMSQEKLGEHLGITFQQVQKYEKGTNRIGASRLQSIANILQVPIAFFFEDAPNLMEGFEVEPMENASSVVEFLSTPEGLQLNKAFSKISEPRIRKRVVDLVVAIAGSEDGELPG